MKRNLFCFCLALVAALFSLLPSTVSASLVDQDLSSDEVDAFLEEMSQVLFSMKSMQVDFEQERHLAMFLKPLVSKGICFFEDPGRLRWEIFEPYKSLLIFNGNSVAKYDFSQGEPRRLNLGSEDVIREVLVQIMDWMKGDFRASAEIYDIRISRNEDYQLRLIPQSRELLENIKFIELYIDNRTKHITQVLIRETKTDFVRIEFTNERNNLELDEKLFDLKNPLIWAGMEKR